MKKILFAALALLFSTGAAFAQQQQMSPEATMTTVPCRRNWTDSRKPRSPAWIFTPRPMTNGPKRSMLRCKGC